MDNKNKNPNVPNLRFPFYDKPWQITTIGNCCRSLDYGLGASAIDYDGKHKYIRITDIDEETNTFSNINITSPSYYDEEHKVKINDILFARTGASVGKTYCYNPKDGELYYAGFLIAAHVKNEFDPKFIFYNTVTTRYKNWVKIMSARSGQPGINADEYRSHTFYIPIKDEQLKISAFLSKLDERILLQNKIIEDLIALRKSIIERTFSLVNSSWNKFTFNDIFIERKEMHIKDSSVIHATLSKEGIFPKTDRYDRDFLVKDEDKKYKVSYLNDICYNPANLKFGVITRNNYGKCIISPIYVTYEVKPNFNPKFIELFVTRSAFLKEIRKYEQGTVYERMAVSSDDFLTYTTRLPDVDFQNEIVSKIDLFDKKITQEKIYLELLKNQKNYLLSNLFI